MWVAMGQGQIPFLFDGHGMYFLFFFNTKLNSSENDTHIPYLAMLEKADISGSN